MATKYQEKSCSFQSIAARAGFLVALVALVGGGALTSCSSGSSNTSSTSTTNWPHQTSLIRRRLIQLQLMCWWRRLQIMGERLLFKFMLVSGWRWPEHRGPKLVPNRACLSLRERRPFFQPQQVVFGSRLWQRHSLLSGAQGWQCEVLGSRGSCQGAAATCKTGPGAFRLNVVVTKDT